MQYTVSEDQHGQRLDVFVVTAMPRLSRAFVHKLCGQGKVHVGGEPAKPGYKIRYGDVIEVDYDIAELDVIPSIDLPVIYEDDDCVVINKPAGVLTHTQGAFNPEPTVASFLRDKVADMEGERAGIVHRLDRATSGVIIGAKNTKALSALQKQFAQRKTKKTYRAIVKGHLAQEEAIIDMPIERNPRAPATFRVGANGKSAATHYKVLQTSPTASLIELTPETGRTHQLRVHLAHIGHPIIGDPLYGSGQHGDRLYLHALSLELTLPNRERKTFTAPLPPEFEEYMQQ
jgi:23S rRNA pseudouridine1911/1915/1917 synthase